MPWIFSVLYILTNNDNADIMIKEHTVTVGGQFLLPERGGSLTMTWNDFFQFIIALSNVLLVYKAFSNCDNTRK